MKNFKILERDSFLVMINNSVDSKIFNSIIVEEEGTKRDLLNDGEFSCAFFVSGILVINQLLTKVRATVSNLSVDLFASEKFREIPESEIQAGDIIIWEKFVFPDGSVNAHVGFYLGDEWAVSTSYANKKVIKHHYKNFGQNGEERKIEKVFRINF